LLLFRNVKNKGFPKVDLKRVTLFRFFGFKVKADASWFFLAVLISWTMSTKVYPGLLEGQSLDMYNFMGIMTVAGILVSIIAHEVAHAIIAEYYHMPIASITLFIFGGVAEMKGEPSHPKGEFLMALAGPVMSALMGFFFWALAHLYAGYIRPGPISVVLRHLGDLNMLIALFNLVPAFPLDGGRALRAIIWRWKNNLVLATRIASESGSVFAYGLIAYACYVLVMHDDMMGAIWWGLLGFFVHGSGAYAVRQMESRSLLGDEKVSRFMHGHITTVSPDLSITDLVDNYIHKHYQKVFPVVDRGMLVGTITLQSVLSLDRHKWHWLHVGSVMEPLTKHSTVSPDYNAADALEIMQKYKVEQLLVAEEGKLLGAITFRDLASYLAISMKIDHNKPVEKSRTAY
jgi:Zn-dependent protease/predicted transcriptional regulator